MAVMFIVPFGIWRFVNGQYQQAFFDFVLVIALLVFRHLASTHSFSFHVAWGFAAVYVLAVWTVVGNFGTHALYWAYPAGIAIHFILRSAQALFANLLILLGSLYLAYPSTPLIELLTFGATFIMVTIFSSQFATRMHAENHNLQHMAMEDALTHAGNRRALDDKIFQILSHYNPQTPYCMLIIDIDFFKHFNDTYGHVTGDQVLIRLVTRMNQLCQKTELVYRYGGEEFCILSQCSLDEGLEFAEKIRAHIARTKVIREESMTVSIGVAEYNACDSARDWFRNADEALYYAKASGRNQVQAYPITLNEEMIERETVKPH